MRKPAADVARGRMPRMGGGGLVGATRALACHALALGVAAVLTACTDDGDAGVDPESTTLAKATQTYAAIALAAYQDSAAAAKALQTANDALIAAPDAGTLAAARKAWLAAREPYLQTEVFRFYDGPIELVEGLVNAWPLDEAYIDYTADDAKAGIINDGQTAITAEKLAELNEFGGDANVATGFHAIEFLLWGQDLSAAGPGARPASDYVEGAGGTAAQQGRRGQYLQVVSALLVNHLEATRGGFVASDAGSWVATWLRATPQKRLRDALTGMYLLAGFETGGERLQAALDSGSQEDEHSCFSDNTHRDMVQDIRGIHNVWRGKYLRSDGVTLVDGPGVGAAVAEVDATLAATVGSELTAALQATEALQPPFDREIAAGNAEGRARVQAAIDALRKVEASLSKVFAAFGLDLPQPE